jgi:hypothetical protein
MLVGESATATSNYFDVFISKITQTGSVQWAHTIPATNNGDAGFSIIEIVPDYYLITGDGYNPIDSSTDVIALLVDSSGNEISKRFYNYSQVDIGFEITPSIYGGVLIAGTNYGMDDQYCLIYDTLPTPLAINTISENKSNFYFYPDIINESGTIHFNMPIEKFYIAFYDLAGKMIYQDYINQRVKQYHLKSSFKNGFYISKIITDKLNCSQKFLFNK